MLWNPLFNLELFFQGNNEPELAVLQVTKRFISQGLCERIRQKSFFPNSRAFMVLRSVFLIRYGQKLGYAYF